MKRLIRVHAAVALSVAVSLAQAAEQSEHHEHMHPPEHEMAQPSPHTQPEHQHEHEQGPPSDAAEAHAQYDSAHHEHNAATSTQQTSTQPTESELAHVPPPPPQYRMRDMSDEEMAAIMAMDDAATFGMALFDQLEWRDTDAGNALAWNGRAWYGGDYNKAVLKSEGERLDGEIEGTAELLWDRVISRWWSVQAGVAHDFGEGPSRNWATVGLQGLAPYWFEVEAALYVGEQGRTAARFAAEYEMFLTQRWVLQPKVELNLYGQRDRENDLGAGLSDASLGLRLRYEIRREFAPYVGVVWSRVFGDTADLARAHAAGDNEWQAVAGLRMWF